MENIVKNVRLTRLRNEEHFGFHAEFVKVTSDYSLSEAFVSLLAIYQGHYDELDDALEVVRQSAFTKQVKEADALQLYTYRRLRSAVRGFLRHSETPKRRAAERVIAIIRHYGNLAHMSRDKRTYGITHMLGDLRDQVSADLTLLGVTSWMTELETHNQAYKNLKDSRTEEREIRHPAKKVDEARELADAAYQAVVRELNNLGLLTPADENMVSLVFRLNDKIDYYNHLVAQRVGIMAAQKNKLEETTADSSSSSGMAG
ncbi:MAG: DUF6261 family protein [Puniceicoccales bacterium]|jgi:hypothetical protein|nr:DUF6261 family protein [Puniceicoccales bacterium]